MQIKNILLIALLREWQKSEKKREQILDSVCNKETWGFNRHIAINFFSENQYENDVKEIRGVLAKNDFYIKWEYVNCYYHLYIPFPQIEITKSSI